MVPSRKAPQVTETARGMEEVDFMSEGSRSDTLLGHHEDIEARGSESSIEAAKSYHRPAWATSAKSKSFLSRFKTSTTILFWIGAVSLLMICFFTFTTGLRWQLSIDRKCFEIESNNSPAAQEVDTAFKLVELNSTASAQSPFRAVGGYITPDVDKAWDDMTTVRPMSVTEEEVLRSGEPTDAVRLPDGGYLARAQIINEMTCLNKMRKAMFYNWNYYKETAEFKTPNYAAMTAEIDNCMEMIRQALMCNADTGLQLHHWEAGSDAPVPNESTMHQCRNFDSVLDWTKKRQVPAEMALTKQHLEN